MVDCSSCIFRDGGFCRRVKSPYVNQTVEEGMRCALLKPRIGGPEIRPICKYCEYVTAKKEDKYKNGSRVFCNHTGSPHYYKDIINPETQFCHCFSEIRGGGK